MRLLAWPAIALAAALAVVVLMVGVAGSFSPEVDRADLVSLVERTSPARDPDRLERQLEALDRVLTELERDPHGLTEPDGPPLDLRPRIAAAFLGAYEASGEDPAEDEFAALRFDLVPLRPDLDALDRALFDEVGAKQVREVWWIRFAAEAYARADLSAEERHRRVERALERAWPEPGSYRELGRLYAVTWFAQRLGRTDLLTGHREAAREILAACWVGKRSRSKAPAGFRESRTDRSPSNPSAASEAVDTQLAVELMRAYGVPSSVDLGALRNYLADEALPGRLPVEIRAHWFSGDPIDVLVAHLALHQLERLPEWSRPSALERLVATRMSLGALLLVALCLVAVVRTREDAR